MRHRITAALVLVAALIVALLFVVGAPTAQANGGTDCVAGATSQTCPAKAIEEHECDADELHFVITQVDEEANAPTSITVHYEGGGSDVIALSAFTGGTAHYATDTSGGLVVSATAVIYLAWSGQFNLSHGLCGESTTTTSESTTQTTPNDTGSTSSSSSSTSSSSTSTSEVTTTTECEDCVPTTQCIGCTTSTSSTSTTSSTVPTTDTTAPPTSAPPTTTPGGSSSPPSPPQSSVPSNPTRPTLTG